MWKMSKKVRKIFGNVFRNPLSLHPLRERNTSWSAKNRFWKIFEKSLKKICRFGKSPYLCTRFGWMTGASDTKKVLTKSWKKSSKKIWNFGNKFLPLQPESTARPMRKRFWKISEKIFQKDLVVQKITLTFAPLSAEKQRSESRRRSKDPTRRKERNCSYSNIRTAFFEVFEQLKFSHSLRRVISNNTFEIWAKDL